MKGFFNFKSITAWIIVFPLVLSSCRSEQENKDVLSQPEMVSILIDVYLAEQKTLGLALPNDSASTVFSIMERRLFEKHGVSDSIFKKSYNYYQDHPKEFQMIYTALVDSLQLLEQRSSVPQQK